MRSPRRIATEMYMWTLDASRSVIMAPWSAMNAIRTGFRVWGMRFWPQGLEAADTPTVNYRITRSLYRNDGETQLGSGFCKPIVDLQVGFIGVPTASTNDEILDDFLNECLHDYWPEGIQQMIRDSLRDSKTVVRLHRPDIDDPLMTVNEAEHCEIEVIAPERVEIERDPANKRVIKRAVISHRLCVVVDPGNVEEGRDPQVEDRDVLEFIDQTSFRFWDNTNNQWLDSLRARNRFGFVPLLEVFNEWDSALQDGSSEYESVIPFIRAFHDLMVQSLQAHKYHSTPKVKLKLREVSTFLKNNFPDVFDPTTGQLMPQSKVDWKGREIMFFTSDEDAEFLEAKSILGDSKTLAEFLIDCICIASQTPEWAFMRVDAGSANSDRNAQTVPLVKKIDRKRINYTKPVQELLKMAMVIQGRTPIRPKLTWEMIRTDDTVVYWQAFQQLVMGLEVARQGGEISDETYMKMVRSFLPLMKPSTQERKDAEKDRPVLPAAQGNGAGAPQNVPAITGGPQGRNE
jgi:hypothetical protein